MEWRPTPLTEDAPELPEGASQRCFTAEALDGQVLRCLLVTRPDGARALQISVRSPLLAPDDHAPLVSRTLTLEELWGAARALLPRSLMALVLAVPPAQLCDATLLEYQRLPSETPLRKGT
jgi:hypothetical protein